MRATAANVACAELLPTEFVSQQVYTFDVIVTSSEERFPLNCRMVIKCFDSLSDSIL